MDIKKLFLDNPRRRKVYLRRNDVEVGFTEIELSPTINADGSCSPNAPVRIYDTSGKWSDPNFHFDRSVGLPAIREKWIDDMGVEVVGQSPSDEKVPFNPRKIKRLTGGQTQM